MNRILVPVLLSYCALASSARADAPEYVWLEGEAPTAINVKPNIAGWGRKEFLSGEKWLHVSIDADKVDKEVSAEGVVIKYAFAVKKDGPFEVWDRIGFEFVRSRFAWRIDGDDWTTVKPDELTSDLMALEFWTEVAWLKLGDRQLTAGEHALEIKLPKTQDDKGKTQRILYASDAICLHAGKFVPNSKNKPDEDGRDAQDRMAERTVFALPEPPSASQRTSVTLKGLWEVCRHDEQLPGEVAQPIKDLPPQPHWKAIPVPGDRNELRPDLLFAHRLWYRTRVQVPQACAGRSFHIVFPQNNLNTTVFVNGVYCGFNKEPFARFSLDVTRGIKPGVNEVWVGIRDAWYGYSANPKDPMKLRKKFNLPLKFAHEGFQDLAYPIWGNFQSGILATPELVVAGSVTATDVFCKPSVARKELAVEVTLANRTAKKTTATVNCAAVDPKTGKVAHQMPVKEVVLDAGEERTDTMAGSWADAKLWWPDQPHVYHLRTTVSVDGKAVDVSETPFGFREWSWQGRDFKLNGIVWHGWADTHTHSTKEQWLDFYHQSNQKFMRFWGTKWMGLPPDEALDWFDTHGIVVRRSGILDGEAIGYMAIENDPELKKESPLKMDLMRNWRDQVVAQVKGERNHPSVMLWSIENEWLYINCINLYGGLMDQFEAETIKTMEAVRAVDPTRPSMTDGGGATKSNGMPVHGDHYTTGPFPKYPALAYDANVTGGGRGRWAWDEKRPRFIGEELFAQGHNPAFAYFGGEEAFVGQVQSRKAVGLCVRILTEGYRWAGQGAVHFWQMQDVAEGQYAANAPRAVFCRQWDWSFGSGQDVKRTFGIFNDTRFADPITFTWTLTLNGKKVAGAAKEYRVPPGGSEKFDLTLALPEVTERTEGELTLTLAVQGKEVFHDVKPVSILAASQPRPKLTPAQLLVYDPLGATAIYLKARRVGFTPLTDLKTLPDAGKVLVIGKDALTAAESTSSALAAYASAGRTVIVLEQKHPLKYQAFPAEMEAATNDGRTAFAEDLDHPALRGLKQKDFFTWGADEVVYRDAYAKPTRGAKSLVQCHEKLQNTALAEVPVGNGLLLLCQLVVAEKLEATPVAQHLLANLIDHGAAYRLTYRPVTAVLGDDPQLGKALDAIGLKYVKSAGPLEALAAGRIAVIAATPANLKVLADNAAKVAAFNQAGGWIVFHGLTPEGLPHYNAVVGVDHMIRPFRRERVTLPARKSPLTAGLTTGDVVLYSSKRIFPWQEGNYVAADIYSYVVDFEDVAPFAQFPNDFLLNLVNGFGSADGWPLIVNLEAPDKPPLDWVLKLPKEQEIREFHWAGNTFYYPVTRVELIFDGKESVSFTTKPNTDVQVFEVNPPRKAKSITLRLADWEKVPGKKQLTGADNIWLLAKRPPEFYTKVRPMLNVGGLMEYPRGPGGLVLCNLLFKDAEDVPDNVNKKRTILAAVLRNLQAPFAGGKTVIAGAALTYQPIDISKQANLFRDEKGWFGDRQFTFKDLPTGKQKFAGVPYEVYDFPTSPVPTAVTPEARGITVGRKADALFFLHAARIDARRNAEELKDRKKYELCRYVITYTDGEKVRVPVYAEIDIEHYRQETPAAVPGAQIAWTRPYEGTKSSAVAYAKQWDNPRPDVVIASIDIEAGEPKRGTAALLAVTAATAAK